MSQNNYSQSRQEFEEFRKKLYQSFNYRRDTVMDLVDAIAANTKASSPVELSLSSLFTREYSALYKGIKEFNWTTQSDSTEAEKKQKLQIEARIQAIAELIPTLKQKHFYLWAMDVILNQIAVTPLSFFLLYSLLLPAPCSLLPAPCSLLPAFKYMFLRFIQGQENN